MNNIESERLLQALSSNMTAEEVQLSSLQGLIAAEISMKRIERGLTQKQFAEYMGVSQALVSRWETGDCNFTLSTLVFIASKLGISMQNPFVLKRPCLYTSGTSKIINIPKNWSCMQSSAPEYSVPSEEELKEM